MHTGLSVDDGIVIDKSRMNREVHVRFRESLRVKAPLATRLRGRGLLSPSYSIDRFLPRCKKAVIALAAFSEQRKEHIFTDAFDVPVEVVFAG